MICGNVVAAREIQSHVAEPFWFIHVSYRPPPDPAQQQQQQPGCDFKWARDRLFDVDVATMLYEACALQPTATVMQVRQLICVAWHGCYLPQHNLFVVCSGIQAYTRVQFSVSFLAWHPGGVLAADGSTKDAACIHKGVLPCQDTKRVSVFALSPLICFLISLLGVDP